MGEREKQTICNVTIHEYMNDYCYENSSEQSKTLKSQTIFDFNAIAAGQKT